MGNSIKYMEYDGLFVLLPRFDKAYNPVWDVS
jgi:hypothetical protein